MKRRRGCLWFAAGLLLALMAGVLIFISVQRATTPPKQVEEPVRVPVLVAARDIPQHAVLAPEDVTVLPVPPEMVPEDALVDASEAVGKFTTTGIGRGEIMRQARVLAPDYVGPQAALTMDPKDVLIAYPASDLLSTLGVVRPDDHVDLMLSFDFGNAKSGIETGLNTFTLLQDLRIAAVIYEGGGSDPSSAKGPAIAFLIAINEQDALMLKYFRDSGAQQDFALRSPAAEGPFEVVPIDGDYVLQRLKIRYRVKQ